MYLSDGTCIPSYLSVSSRGSSAGSTSMLNDYVLRFGEIKKVVFPDDPQSYGKRTVEYEVEVQYREGNGSPVTSIYRGCTTSTLFGGAADRFHATLRPDTSGSNSAIGTGSKVLLLCLSGDQQKAIILGGVEDPSVARQEKKDTGHNLHFEFNGVRFTIDAEGQAVMTFRGATKANGKLSDKADPAAEGSFIKFSKNGSILIGSPKEDQSIEIDHENKSIYVWAQKDWLLQVVDGRASIQSTKDVSLQSKTGKLNVNTALNVNIKSLGVLVGEATDAWMKGTTYRANQGVLHAQMSSTFGTLAGLVSSAGASLTAGSALNAIPIVGGLLAAPLFIAAGVSLTSAGPLFGAMAGFIQAFEGQSFSYLSLKNKTD